MRNYEIERALSGDIEAPVIRLDDVSKDYADDMHALKHINLVVNKGEFVFVVGTSGSGKSTFIKLLMKEIAPSSGKIYVLGKDISRLKSREIAMYRRNIGIVFQDFRLLPEMTVFENVAFAQRVIETPLKKINRDVPRILSVMGLSERLSAYPKELSGGEQQRVALARALVNNPMLLLADEPTGNLDPKNSWEIMRLLGDINKKGTTVIVVTHNKEIVDMMQKRVVHLSKGVLTNDYEKGGYSNAKN
ncbi:MAG: cell division ATP-binding protein FtsE [Lachnospiraceae bacterium]|nr:cell division ATP-binding protein FtsE [Lachnospiraceae bacterium]